MILQIEPTREQIMYSVEFLKKGGVAHRGDFDGDELAQLFGIQAQVVVHDYLKLPRPENNGRFDGGWDLEYAGKKWDVKTILLNGYMKHRWVHNVSGHQANYVSDGFIFISYNKEEGIFQLCGWITKDDFYRKAQFFKEGTPRPREDGTAMIVKGSAGMFEISQKDLKSFTTFLNQSSHEGKKDKAIPSAEAQEAGGAKEGHYLVKTKT